MNILVTGAAGFIGFHVAQRLLNRGDQVTGVDNLNGYYDPALKRARLEILQASGSFSFVKCELADRESTARIFQAGRFDRVIHLAAQAGVRHSLDNPHAYVDSNLVGFVNILEGCRHGDVQHLVYASSSSVYGMNTSMPFSVHDQVDHPISLYAATKKANELMAHTYSHLFKLPTTGLRFFSVYGPWGRPDMAYFSFTRAILAGQPIGVYNHGKMRRDFTYIDDIVEGVVRVGDHIPAANAQWDAGKADPGSSSAPYRIYNIGNSDAVELGSFIAEIEKQLGIRAKLNLLPMQPGDLPASAADISDLAADIGFSPSTPIEIGVERFVAWYKDYHRR